MNAGLTSTVLIAFGILVVVNALGWASYSLIMAPSVHRSPGFITSNLIGKRLSDGAMIKEYEASHGTVADMWAAHLRGEETSMNPLGMAEALLGAMNHAAVLA